MNERNESLPREKDINEGVRLALSGEIERDREREREEKTPGMGDRARSWRESWRNSIMLYDDLDMNVE